MTNVIATNAPRLSRNGTQHASRRGVSWKHCYSILKNELLQCDKRSKINAFGHDAKINWWAGYYYKQLENPSTYKDLKEMTVELQ